MDFDGAAFRAVIHGIADYVVKCAVEVAFISQYFGIFGHFFYHQIDDLAVFLRQSLTVFHQVPHKRHQFQRLFFKFDVGRFQTRQGQQFAHQRVHPHQFAFQTLQILFLLLRLRLYQADNRLHTRQRRTHFMRNMVQ